ncbi:hypothetical protein ACFLTP_10295 [Chloroflexota bacterium]
MRGKKITGAGNLSGIKDKGMDRFPVSKSFKERLVGCNSQDDTEFEEWLFHPAMMFGSWHKWWGDMGNRDKPHEGLDLYFYRTKKRHIHYLDRKTKVPVIFKGQVMKVDDDFLGESLFVSHDHYDNDGSQLYTIYSHIKSCGRMCLGEGLEENDIIGTIADTKKSVGVVPPHLHVSVVWVPKSVRSRELGWEIISSHTEVTLIDPLRVIECPYSIVASI